ncbi:lipoyl(octanoyl) transferase LipB [Amycolatopsis sp. NPDC004169]|uniref:lipoyl(octanoyl) transferase LipB n=1 Tax=Amycolatopsis sp. NPDC004169 TaxID=3154453 RepID=UPI0033B430E1
MGWPIKRVDLGEVAYHQALADMSNWVQERQQGLAEDRLFLLSHPPIVTYGPRTRPEDLPTDLPAVPADRGGFATYHGPGQLVVDVKARGPVDIVRWLETGLVAALEQLGFPAVRRDTPAGSSSLAGVWTPDHRKVASIGLRIRRGVTSHGFALNVDPDMAAFRHFTACGLADVTMVSLAELAAEQRRETPSDAGVRDAVFAALTAGS